MQEHYLHALLQPRERPDWRGWRAEDEEGGVEGSDDGLDAKGDDEGDGGQAKSQRR